MSAFVSHGFCALRVERRICSELTRHGCGCDGSNREVRCRAKCSGCELFVWWYTVSSQSLGEKWAGCRGAGTTESSGCRAKPKGQSPTQRPQKLPRRLDIARAQLDSGQSRIVAQQQQITPPHVNHWLVSQAICQTRCRHRRRSLKIFHTIFPQFTKHLPLYAPPTAVIAPTQIKAYRRPSYHRQNGRQKIRTRSS